MLEELDKEELLALISAYDRYIQSANNDNRYADGWYPVCISEFYNNEFQEDYGQEVDDLEIG